MGKALLLMIAGCLLMLLSGTLHPATPAQPGEYYYTGWLSSNYTVLTACLLLIAGWLIGYYLQWRPWPAGISLLLV